MFKEVISPNVSYIQALDIELGKNVGLYSATLHPKGVIEMDTDWEIEERIAELFNEYEEAGHLYPVTVTGLKTSLQPESLITQEHPSEKEGSVRFCAWDASFAEDLTDLIKRAEVPELVQMDDGLWEFECVSKYFRFMRYKKGGEHFPHYDSDFVVYKNEGTLGQKVLYATKYSLVMYFNDCESGEIAFVNHDGKDKSDWPRQAMDHEIFLKLLPQAGKIVLFPHDVCHTVLPFNDEGYRYIVRGDLIFTKVA